MTTLQPLSPNGEKWFGNIIFSSEQERTFIVRIADIFEEANNHNLQKLVQLIRQRCRVIDIFHPVIMANREIIQRLWTHLKNFKAEVHPSLAFNARLLNKIACIIYPPETSSNLCDIAFEQIKEFEQAERETRRQSSTTSVAGPSLLPATTTASNPPIVNTSASAAGNPQVPDLSSQHLHNSGNTQGFPPSSFASQALPFPQVSHANISHGFHQPMFGTHASPSNRNIAPQVPTSFGTPQQFMGIPAQAIRPPATSFGLHPAYISQQQYYPTAQNYFGTGHIHGNTSPFPQTLEEKIFEARNFLRSQGILNVDESSKPAAPQIRSQDPRYNSSQEAHRPSQIPDSNTFVPGPQEAARVARDVGNRFKSRENKYSGSSDEDINVAYDLYEAMGKDYMLTPRQKLQYLHNLFTGEALKYYNDVVFPNSTSFGEAFTKLRNHFVNPQIQMRNHLDLSSLKFDKFLEKSGSPHEALKSILDYIRNKSKQVPADFRSEGQKIQYLKNAIMTQEWAEFPLQSIGVNTTFKDLGEELSNALLFNEQRQTAQGDPKDPLTRHGSPSKPQINFTQGRYAREIAGKLFPGYPKNRDCWNCGKPGHRVTRCREQLNPARIAARKAEFLKSKKGKPFVKSGLSDTKQVLFEMVSGLNELFGADLDFDKNDPASVFFELEDSDGSCSDSSTDSKEAEPVFGDIQDSPNDTYHF